MPQVTNAAEHAKRVNDQESAHIKLLTDRVEDAIKESNCMSVNATLPYETAREHMVIVQAIYERADWKVEVTRYEGAQQGITEDAYWTISLEAKKADALSIPHMLGRS